MKKLAIILSLVLALSLCTAALAAEIRPMADEDPAAMPLADGTYAVYFKCADITGQDISFEIYTEDIFDIVDVDEMKEGDTLYIEGDAVTVETLERDGDRILVNGGYDEGGATLYNEEDSNGWTSMGWDYCTYTSRGTATIALADSVEISVYQMDEDLSIAGDGYDTVSVEAAGVRPVMDAVAELLGDGFVPAQASVSVENGVVTGIVIDYVP